VVSASSAADRYGRMVTSDFWQPMLLYK